MGVDAREPVRTIVTLYYVASSRRAVKSLLRERRTITRRIVVVVVSTTHSIQTRSAASHAKPARMIPNTSARSPIGELHAGNSRCAHAQNLRSCLSHHPS